MRSTGTHSRCSVSVCACARECICAACTKSGQCVAVDVVTGGWTQSWRVLRTSHIQSYQRLHVVSLPPLCPSLFYLCLSISLPLPGLRERKIKVFCFLCKIFVFCFFGFIWRLNYLSLVCSFVCVSKVRSGRHHLNGVTMSDWLKIQYQFTSLQRFLHLAYCYALFTIVFKYFTLY